MKSVNGSLLDTTSNCWRIGQADRFSWLVDGDSYFGALRSSMEAAQQEILIVGWDIDSRVELILDEDSPHYPSPLAATLESLAKRKKELNIFVLSWDFAMVYMLERELFPAFRFGWEQSERLNFQLDNRHAAGASHHQKFVVIDGRIAFVGGLDLTKNRWDTSEHAPGDPRRVNHEGNPYRPFHDVQAAVTGDVASHLRELGAFRWENATGRSLPDLKVGVKSDPQRYWPDDIKVRGEDVTVGISRTWAFTDDGGMHREIEQAYLDMIAAAQRIIYIENQYFTSESITAALRDSLRAERGPEILIVLPGATSGWLEQATMETLRNRCINRLRRADHYNRLLVMTPELTTLQGESINVHSKVMTIDDRWLRIGSANISGRSMGLDSECDLIVEDSGHGLASHLRAELIAEHIGADANDVESSIMNLGLLETVRSSEDGKRRLSPIEVKPDDRDRSLEPIARLTDLEAPIEHYWGQLKNGDRKGSLFESADKAGATPFIIARWSALFLFLAVFGGWSFWQMYVAESGFDVRGWVAALTAVAAHPLAPVFAIPAFVVGSMIVMPVTGMIAVCGLLFDPVTASVTATTGVLAAAALNYAVAGVLGRAALDRVPDTVTTKMRALAASSDTWALAGLRLIPIAPFTVFNVVAGACGVRWRDFMLGTLIGMGPGTVLICISIDQARAALTDKPILDPWIMAAMACCGIALIALRVIYKGRSD